MGQADHSASGGGRRPQYGQRRDGRAQQRHPEGPLYGALDLGTNNCRLLIARPYRSGFRVVSSYSKIVRLGEGLSESGRLSEAAMRRTIDVLKTCADKLQQFGVKQSRIVSTEACRRADNCHEFLERVEAETGLVIEPITVEEEARLALAGCQPLLTGDSTHALVFDIGGGSTELVWAVRGADQRFEIVDVLSLPIGVVNLAERYGHDAVSPECYRDMKNFVAAHLPPFCLRNGIGDWVGEGLVQMLGTSGTVTTLGAIHLDLPRYSRSRIDGLEIEFSSLSNATRMLSALNLEGRAALPCIGEERADLVVPGCAILEAICDSWPVGQLRVADRGLREGMLLELMISDGLPVTGNPPARGSDKADHATSSATT